MRYLTVLLAPTEGAQFHPIGSALRADPSIAREAIHHIELLADETVLVFAEGSGDSDRYEEIMRTSPLVDEFLVSGDDRWMAVSQFEPSRTTRRLLEFERESDVVIETPIEINSDGSLEVTYVGSETALQQAVGRVGDDTPMTYEVLEMGRYDPDANKLFRVLTARQQEVLEAAVTAGYYTAPRQATHEDVADRLGLAPTTVGEHLRKIEQRVFRSLVRN